MHITRQLLISIQPLIALALCACEPTIPEGRFACQSLAECPPDWYCVQGYCYATLLGACVPTSCEGYQAECGTHPDGCGGVTPNCGACTSAAEPYCDGNRKCSSEQCIPIMACPDGACGFISNNCGGVIECSPCCTPTTCQEQQIRCGTIDNGCGIQLDCEAETGGCGIGGRCEGVACVCDATEEVSNEVPKEAQQLEGPFPLVHETSNLHSASDVDWFKVELANTVGIDAPRRFRAVLSEIPSPSNYELRLGIICQTVVVDSDCVAQEGETPDQCSNPADASQEETVFADYHCTGKVIAYVQVVPITWGQTCAPYKLQLLHGSVPASP